jgi:diguanylate cyclase (GGDEF)-like protein
MLTRFHTATERAFSSRSPETIFFISIALLLMLGWFDYLTGDYSLIVFYLIPVSLAAWFVSKRSGLILCVLALITRITADEAYNTFSFQNSALHYWNISIEFVFLMIMSLLFSMLKENLNDEKEQARIDPLTGALNRRAFFDLAEQEVNRSRRYSRSLTVAYIDLDNFKAVNDRFGHNAGDELLVTVVETIRSNIRSYEILSRFGGDEFVIMLPEADEEAALSFLTKIQCQLQQAMAHRNWPVSVSIGAIIYLSAPPDVDEIIRRADELMYSVKRSGKDRVLHTVVQ